MKTLFPLILITFLYNVVGAQDLFQNTTTTNIADNSTTEIDLAVSLTDPNFGLEEICITISHTYFSDLRISLISPMGTEIMLSDENGDGSSSGTICFNNFATTSISGASLPFDGDYLAQEDIGLFNATGENFDGTWTLRIRDLFPADVGQVTNFSLLFSNNPSLPFTAQNDDCSTAEELTVNQSFTCTVVREDATINGATNSNVSGNCTTYPNVFDDDVWFSFVATSSVHEIRVNNLEGDAATLIGEVFSGNCNSLTHVDCYDFSTGTFSVSGLTSGNTYYVRVASTSSGLNTKFDICVKEGVPPPPSNDDCENAIAVDCGSTLYTVNGATASGINATCPFTLVGNFNDDVWFAFQATGGTNEVTFSNVSGSSTALDAQILSGTCPGSLTELFCYTGSGANQSFLVADLVDGQTYFLRVASFRTQNENTTFQVCVQAPGQSTNPHDECLTAGAIPINVGQTCEVSIGGSLVDARPSSVPNTCVDYPDFNDDVWFSFTAGQTTYSLNIENISGVGADLMYELFSGACNALTQVLCQDDPDGLIILTNLTVGTEYFLRVASYDLAPQTTTFDLCLTADNPPPANDECVNAATISTDCNNLTSSTLLLATASTQATNCSFNGGQSFDDDIWFVLPNVSVSAYQINVTNIQGSTGDLVFEVFTTTTSCDNLTYVRCHDDPNTELILNNLVNGNDYYIRVASWSNVGQTTTFDICATTPPTPPANDECATATQYPAIDTSCQEISVSLVGATSSTQSESCGFEAPFYNDVWVKFTAHQEKEIIEFNNIVNAPDSFLVQVGSGTCNAFNEVVCYQISGGTVDPMITLANLTPNTDYYLRLASYSFDALATTFDICIHDTIPDPPANDECANAVQLTVVQDTSCTSSTSGTLQGATASTQADCAGSAGFDDDVWYSFEADEVAHVLSLSNIAGSTQDLEIQVLSGSCGSLIEAFCLNTSGSASFSQELNDLTPGTYYVRLATVPGGIQNVTFDICIHDTIPDPPANDECANAVQLTVVQDTSCTSSTSGTLLGATASTQTDCAGSAGFDDDVWYEFTADEVAHVLSLSNISGSTQDLEIQVLSGATCGTLTEAFCLTTSGSATFSQELNGLTAGTYYVRLATVPTGIQNVTFDICIHDTIPDSPANDECTAAVQLTVVQDTSCTSSTSGTLLGATASTQTDCAGSAGFDDDVWYRFTADEVAHVLSLSNISGSTQDLEIQVLSGATCGALTEEFCLSTSGSATFTQELNGLTLGTYYIRLATVPSGIQNVTFDICIHDTIPDPPANNMCSGALSITATSDQTCTSTSGAFLGATSTGGLQDCGVANARDVWFSFVAAATEQKISVTSITNGTLSGLQVYGGTCGALGSVLLCHTSIGQDATMNGLSIGSTYYIRVLNNYSSDPTFDICVKGVPPSGCDLNVTTTASSGPGSLREALGCADVDDTITFTSGLAGSTVLLATPTLVVDHEVTFLADFNDNITLSNEDINNTSVLISIQDLLKVEGLKLVGQTDDSMIFQLSGIGNIELKNSEMEKTLIDTN